MSTTRDDKPSHLRDALGLIEEGQQELQFVPKARAVAKRGGPPFEASLHIHIAIGYAQGARRALQRAQREQGNPQSAIRNPKSA